MEMKYPGLDMFQKISEACPIPTRSENLWFDLSDLVTATSRIRDYVSAMLNNGGTVTVDSVGDQYAAEYINIVTELAMLRNMVDKIFMQLPLPDGYAEKQVISDAEETCNKHRSSTYKQCLRSKPLSITKAVWEACVGMRFSGVQPRINSAAGFRLHDVLEAGSNCMPSLMYDVTIGSNHYKDTAANLLAALSKSVKDVECLNRTIILSIFNGADTVTLNVSEEW